MVAFNIETIMENLDNPNVQGLVQNSPDVQRGIQEARERALQGLAVAHPEGDAAAGTLVAVDKGIVGDLDDSSMLGMALSYTEPRSAAGIAVFGMGLLTLPLVAKLHGVDQGLEVEKVGVRDAVGFSYEYCQRTRADEDFEKPLSIDALRTRMGPLDPSDLGGEILLPADEACAKERCSDAEIGRLQDSVLLARKSVRQLRRRSALAFMGLAPNASSDEVNSKYKRMALEMHPDKGGDAERFQQLQDMKTRLSKSIQEEEDDEERNKAQEDEKSKDMPATAKAKQLRREAHKEAVKLWDSAREAEAEIFTDKKMLKGNAQPVLARLRSFVEQFSNSKCRMLPHGNKDKAKEALWQFKVDGLELIATAALLDPSATASLVASHINYKIVSRSGSKEVALDCQAFLEAIADVPNRVDNFLVCMGRERAAALDAEDAKEAAEARAGGPLSPGEEVLIAEPDSSASGTKEGEEDEEQVTQEVRAEIGQRGVVLSTGRGGVTLRLSSGRRLTAPRTWLKRAPPEPRAAQADQKDEEGSGVESTKPPAPQEVTHGQQAQGGAANATPASPAEDAKAAGPKLLARQPEFSVPVAADPERAEWDPSFHHPYVGALDGAGDGIFCRACCRWITTRRYAHEPFLRHARIVHKTPPVGWKGPVPEDPA